MSGSIFTEERTPASTPERRRAVEQLVARMGDEAEKTAREGGANGAPIDVTECVVFGLAEHVTPLLDPSARWHGRLGAYEHLVVIGRRKVIDHLLLLDRPDDAAKVALGPAHGGRVLVCAVEGALAVTWARCV